MKTLLRILPLFISATLSISASVQLGQTSEQIIEALGKPTGTIELRTKTLLLYPQGEVTLKDGYVSEIDLMSDAAFEADQERLRIEREEWLIDKERRAVAHQKEGEALRASKMQSRAFAALPAKDKVDFWRDFQIRYPSVDASQQISSALQDYESELAELRSQQRIAELEARVAQAQNEAATARLETQKLREETERERSFPSNRYTYPSYSNNHYYRPPTVTIHTQKHKQKPEKEQNVQHPWRNPKENHSSQHPWRKPTATQNSQHPWRSHPNTNSQNRLSATPN